MAKWVRLCGVAEAPAAGQATEANAGGTWLCLANVNGELAALDNLCPHRQGPLGQGWVENGRVVCPWHSWAFDAKTGMAEYPVGQQVQVFPLKIEGEDVLVEME